MLPPIVKTLPVATRDRFELAYTDPKRPIGIWERDDIAVSLVQAWMFGLGVSSMPKSIRFDPRTQQISADGVFGDETRKAVIAFQKACEIKPDGMVGHDTLDKISERLHRRVPQPPVTRGAAVTAVKRPYRCPPGALICPEPP